MLLTTDEQELMQLLITGHSYQPIMEMLSIDFTNYKKLKRSLFKKLEVTRTSELLFAFLDKTDFIALNF